VEKVSKTVKVNDETYNKLNKYAGMLRSKERRPVSMSYTISILLEDVEKNDIMSFAGAWSMSDSEADKIKKNLREMWEKWES